MSRERYNGEVPIGEDGNMQSYPLPSHLRNPYPNGPRYIRVGPEMRHLPPFEATLKVVDYVRGQSAMRVIVEDTTTGMRYPMFLSDIFEYLKGVDITATWRPVKKGQNYGIQVVR